MRQGVHTGRSGQALGHRSHHIGVNDSDIGNIVCVNANELSLALNICYNIVDCRFRSSSRSCRNGYCENGSVLGRSNSFKTADIFKFGVVDNDTDSLARIHRRAAAYRYHVIRTRRFVSRNAALDVFDGRVGFYVGINLIRHARFVKQVSHLLGNSEFNKIGVRRNKCFFETFGGNDSRNLLYRPVAVIRNCVQYKTIYHNKLPPVIPKILFTTALYLIVKKLSTEIREQ